MVAQGGREETRCRLAPSGQFVQTGEDFRPAKGAKSLAYVTRGWAQLGPTFRLESDIELPNIVKGRQNAEPRQGGFGQLVSSQASQSLAPDWKTQQCLDDGGHIRTVVHERMPVHDLEGLAVAAEFAPKRARFASQPAPPFILLESPGL